MTLQFKIRGQTLYKLTPGDVVEGTQNYINCQFDFQTEDWEGCIKTALFQPPGGGEPYPVMLVDDTCTVPWEALEHPGLVSVSVFGVRDDYKITSSVVQIRNRATLTGGAATEPPTPTVYEQVLNELAGTRQHATEQTQESKDAAAEAKGYAESAANTVDGFAAVAETASKAITAEGALQASNVQSAGQTAIQSVSAEGESQVAAVGAAGTEALQAVQDAAAEIAADREQISTNKDNIASLQSEMRTKADAIVRTVSGESLLVQDSSDNAVRGLRVFGKTKQVTTTGAQLLSVNRSNTVVGISIDLQDCIATFTGTVIDNPTVKPSINTNVIDILEVGKTYQCYVYDDTVVFADFEVNIDDIITYPGNRYTVLGTESSIKIRIIYGTSISTAGTVINHTCKVGLYDVDNPLSEWEPYTGGIPSPNPQYPQPLESVGDNGSVDVGVYGKNLFVGDYSYGYLSNIDGDITTTGPSVIHLKHFIPTQECVTIYIPNFHAEDSTNYAYSVGIYKEDKTWIMNYVINSQRCVLRIPSEAKYMRFSSSDIYRMQVYYGDVTEYEEKSNYQSIALQTPNGLPGIPVTDASLANYTDADGQMWCADEVDFERGVYVQRIWKDAPTNTIVFTNRDDNGRCYTYSNYFKGVFKSGSVPSMSTIARYSTWANNDDGTFALSGKGIYYKDSTKTLDEVNAMFAELGTNFEVAGILAEPIETPLTSDTLSMYSMLHTNYPVTTVLNDAGAGMEMQYNADTQLYIDNKIAEVLASIANTNAQLL